eukprot:1140376-Pyramimonas_sp.AAC.1
MARGLRSAHNPPYPTFVFYCRQHGDHPITRHCQIRKNAPNMYSLPLGARLKWASAARDDSSQKRNY